MFLLFSVWQPNQTKAGGAEEEGFGSNHVLELLQDFCPEGETGKEKRFCV